MAILDELLKPMSTEEFKNSYYLRSLYASPSKALRFRKLITWPLLSDIFSSGHRDCWLPLRGRLPSEPDLSSGTLTVVQALNGFERGRTVLIRHSERAHPILRGVADDFQNHFGDPVDIQLYVTPPGGEGFEWHYDLEEVFVIQTSGEKEFYLRIPKRRPSLKKVELPKCLDFASEFEGGDIRCRLKAGDWMYIPAGVWHKARAITPSFHLSIGVLSSERDRS